MQRYDYEGPVMEFDTIITRNWRGTTYAPSEKKARSNLAYQYKKQFGRATMSRISLPGKLTVKL